MSPWVALPYFLYSGVRHGWSYEGNGNEDGEIGNCFGRR